MTQAVVQITPVEGGYQAVCRTRDCAWGLEGAPWTSEVHTVKAGAEEDAKVHRQWHRAQRPVPVEPGEWPGWATVTDIGQGRWRLDLDGTVNGTRVKGHATGSLEALRQLVAAIERFEAATGSIAALIARAGLPEDADVATLLGLTWHVTRPLKQNGIETIGDLSARTDEQLLNVPNFGARRLDALKAALTEVRS